MKGWVRLAGLLLLQLAADVRAAEMSIVCVCQDSLDTLGTMLIFDVQDQKEADRQVCSGMYSRKSWGGNMDPFILTKFIKPKKLKNGDDPMVSLVMFEWEDKDLIGVPVEGQGPNGVSKSPLRRLDGLG